MGETLKTIGLIALFALLWIVGLWLRGATYRSVYNPPRFNIWLPFIWLWDRLQNYRDRQRAARRKREEEQRRN